MSGTPGMVARIGKSPLVFFPSTSLEMIFDMSKICINQNSPSFPPPPPPPPLSPPPPPPPHTNLPPIIGGSRDPGGKVRLKV